MDGRLPEDLTENILSLWNMVSSKWMTISTWTLFNTWMVSRQLPGVRKCREDVCLALSLKMVYMQAIYLSMCRVCWVEPQKAAHPFSCLAQGQS